MSRIRMPISIRKRIWIALLIIFPLSICFVMFMAAEHASGAAQPQNGYMLSGTVFDNQGNPLDTAKVQVLTPDQAEPLAFVESHDDGEWNLVFDSIPADTLILSIERPHFQPLQKQIDEEQVSSLRQTGILQMGEIQLERRITPAFWAATIIFILVLILIAFEKLHSTTAALAGLSAQCQ